MDYEVTNTGYNNTQISQGYLELTINDIDEIVLIDVTEVICSNKHDVFMELNFNGESDEHKKNVLSVIDADENDNYRITDDELISELFTQYGSNGG
jgi:hypothetical protein